MVVHKPPNKTLRSQAPSPSPTSYRAHILQLHTLVWLIWLVIWIRKRSLTFKYTNLWMESSVLVGSTSWNGPFSMSLLVYQSVLETSCNCWCWWRQVEHQLNTIFDKESYEILRCANFLSKKTWQAAVAKSPLPLHHSTSLKHPIWNAFGTWRLSD